MSLIYRTWGCQNDACQSVFDSAERAPACPRCGCVRVGWVPGRVNIGTGARTADSDLKTLADMFKLPDLNSAYRDQGAKKLLQPVNGASAGVMNFRGFAANIDPTSARSNNNQSGAQCVPTVNHIDHKVKPGIGAKLTGQLGLAPIATATTITHAHRGKP